MLQRERCVPFRRAAILVVVSSNSVAGATEEGSNLAASTRVETKTRFLQAIASQVGPEVLFGRCALTILRARGLRAADPTRRSDFIEESLIPQHGGG